MQTIKPDAVYFIKDKENNVIGIIFRDELTGHKLVFKAEEYDLEQLAELILTKKENNPAR